MKTLLAVALLSLLRVFPSWGMEMRVVGDQLILSGPITEPDYSKFTQTLTPEVALVVLNNSQGGSTTAALEIASEIRRKGLSSVALGYCHSSCAVMFLGGTKRYLANSRSYVAFHGNYQQRSQSPSPSRVGELARFYDEYTGGKISSDLVELWSKKNRTGFVYFFKSVTYSCEGTEPHRPVACPKLSYTALEQGIITSLEDVQTER